MKFGIFALLSVLVTQGAFAQYINTNCLVQFVPTRQNGHFDNINAYYNPIQLASADDIFTEKFEYEGMEFQLRISLESEKRERIGELSRAVYLDVSSGGQVLHNITGLNYLHTAIRTPEMGLVEVSVNCLKPIQSTLEGE